jgi:hypothetical protein
MRWIAAVVVLLAVGVVVVDDVGTHRELGDVRAERDIAARKARSAEREAKASRRAAEQRAMVDVEQSLADEIARQQTERSGIGGPRQPILTLPAGVPACTAADLQLINTDLSFLRFGHRPPTRPCGLLDWPGIEGRDPTGTWVVVPVQYVDSVSYTDGPPWTGTFTPVTAAVLGIYVERIDEQLGGCRTGPTTSRHFDAVRLVLAASPQRLDLPGVTLDVGPCRPSVRLWSYDVTGDG